MEKKILILSKGLKASSTRYRATDFIPFFEAAGYQVEHLNIRKSLVGYLRLLHTARKADIVIIVRRSFEHVFASLLRHFAQRLIFTFDDAIFCHSNGETSPGRERRFATTLPLCDQIWAGNRYLADKALQFNKNVTIIPTALDTDKYNIQADKPTSTIDLVWIGSHSTKKHLITALPALEAAAEALPSLRLKIIADFSLDSDKLEILPVQWSSKTEAQELASAHIGIAPLPDNAFTRGKCGLKVLQYMAAGLPVISSNAGVNSTMVQHGTTGLLAANHKEWVDAIIQLAKQHDLMQTMGRHGRDRCITHFSLASAFEKMLRTL